MPRLIRLVILGLTMNGVFQTPCPAQAAPEPAGSSWIAGYAIQSALNTEVSFFGRPPRHGTDGAMSYLAARRTEAGGVEWSTDAACPALGRVLKSLDRLAMPDLGIDSLVWPQGAVDFPRGAPLPVESPRYIIRGLGRQPDGGMSQLEISSIHGQVADWVKYADQSLSGCWTQDEPVRP